MAIQDREPVPLFLQVKSLLKPCEGRFAARRDEPGYYDLRAKRPVVVDDPPRNNVFLAGLIVQKSYLDFYFMPPCAGQELGQVFGPEFLAMAKGKSCFRLRELIPSWRH